MTEENLHAPTLLEAISQIAAEDRVALTIAIGEAVLAWNSFHESLAKIFAFVTEPQRTRQALLVWHSQVSDRAQRNLLKAALNDHKGISDELVAGISFLLTKADSLTGKRDETVHTHFILDIGHGSFIHLPDPFSESRFAKSLQGKKPIGEFSKLAQKLRSLDAYSIEIRLRMYREDEENPLPDKPRL